MEVEEAKKPVVHDSDGLAASAEPKDTTEELQRSLDAAKENTRSVKEGLKDLRTRLDEFPKPGEDLSREQRVRYIELKKQEQILLGHERRALEEQLAATKAMKN